MQKFASTVDFPDDFDSIRLVSSVPEDWPVQAKDYLFTFEFYDCRGEKLDREEVDASFAIAFDAPYRYLGVDGFGEGLIGSGVVRLSKSARSVRIALEPWESNLTEVMSLIFENLFVSVENAGDGSTWIGKVSV